MTLASFCGCAGRFESYLVANPEDRFSRDEAHTVKRSLLFDRFDIPICSLYLKLLHRVITILGDQVLQ